ncbi:MAG TPA: hypothetical protein V6C97_13065 [Oculatellaceae cyanobacterium]
MNKMTIVRNSLFTTLALGLILSSSAPSYAGQFAQKHPRRAQVLHRDNRQSARINRDKGQLGGHYKQLSREDNHIRRQEQRDAAGNGGHITKQEQRQLNHEENHLNNQIHRDHN